MVKNPAPLKKKQPVQPKHKSAKKAANSTVKKSHASGKNLKILVNDSDPLATNNPEGSEIEETSDPNSEDVVADADVE